MNLRVLLGIFVFLLFTNQASASPLPQPIIMIDAGHGGIDPGTQSEDGKVLEKHLNLEIAKKLEKQLREAGFQVEMTRVSDEDVTKFAPADQGWGRHRRDLFGRVEAARKKQATMLISIHGNHGTTRNRGGVVYYQKSSFESYMLASELQNRLNRLSNGHSFPRIGNKYYILRNAEIPAVLVEYGYLSNPKELAELQSEAYQNKLVQALSDGIVHFVTFYHFPKVKEGA